MTAGRYRELYERQYGEEHDRFINPGKDFTPEPENVREEALKAAGPVRNLWREREARRTDGAACVPMLGGALRG